MTTVSYVPPVPRRLAIRYIGWKVFLMVFVAPFVAAYTSEGMMILSPGLAKPLYKLPYPGISYLGESYEGRRWTIALLFAFALFALTCWAWERLIQSFTEGSDGAWLIRLAAVGLMIADGATFYLGSTQYSWGENEFSFSGLVLTLGYCCGLIIVSLISVRLKH